MSKKIIITGFDRFGANPYNPTIDVVRSLDGISISGNKIYTKILPTAFKDSAKIVTDYIDSENPYVVISLGLSAADKGTRREDLNLEKKGANIMNAKNPDSNNYHPQNKIIVPDGKKYLYCPWDAEALANHLNENGVRARTSEDAAKYVCNDLIYRVNNHLQQEGKDTNFGFVHMPWLTQYEDKRYEKVFRELKKSEKFNFDQKAKMPIEEVRRGIELLVESMS